MLTLRGNLVNRPLSTVGDEETLASVFPGLQLFIRERFKLSFEYAFQNHDRANSARSRRRWFLGREGEK